MGLVAAAVLTLGVTAFAEGKEKGGREGCSGSKSAEARFKKGDANSDGFLTAAEVGERRWARIKVADTNNDAKVTLAELKQAKADGKMKHKGKGKKKSKDKATA